VVAVRLTAAPPAGKTAETGQVRAQRAKGAAFSTQNARFLPFTSLTRQSIFGALDSSSARPEATMENPNDLSRRDALTKLGKFAAYTAPAMMVLLTSEKAMARSNEDGKGHPGQDTGQKGGQDSGKAGKTGGDPGKPKLGK
jgi:hypothetical protein